MIINLKTVAFFTLLLGFLAIVLAVEPNKEIKSVQRMESFSSVSQDVVVVVETDKKEYIAGQDIQMFITVLNNKKELVTLEFKTSQRYDFIVLKNSQEIWRWSGDKAFAMVLGSLALKPNEKITYSETWKPTITIPGDYQLIGVITSHPRYQATTQFKIAN